MKLMEIFRTKDQSQSPLDQRLHTIEKLLQKGSELKEKVDQLEKKLRQKVAENIASGTEVGDPKISSEIAERRDQLRAVYSLIEQAKLEAFESINQEKQGSWDRIASLNKKLAAVEREISLKRIVAVSDFARSQNLRVTWPSIHNGGQLHIPVFAGVQPSEVAGIIAQQQPPAEMVPDPLATDLAELRAALEHENTLNSAAPNECLSILLHKRRRLSAVENQ